MADAGLGSDTIPTRPSAAAQDDFFWSQENASDANSDVEILKLVWRNEKSSPEILPHKADLVHRVREQIALMEETLSTISGEPSDELMVSMYRMDVDRTMFLLRAYLRVRLLKIEKFAMHILRTEELWQRLSDEEQNYAQRFTDALQKHLENSVLSRLPFGYQSMLKQATSSEDDDMIPEPQLDTFVFCRSKGAIGSFQLDDKGDETVDLMAGDLYILRYRPIRRLLETDRIELI